MYWLEGIAIALIIIIVGFLAFIFVPMGNNYFDPILILPESELITNHIDQVKNDIPDKFMRANAWEYAPIYINRKAYLQNETYELLRRIPNLQRAYYKKILADTKCQTHRECGALSNNYLRLEIPCKVELANYSGIRVDGQPRLYKVGDCILYDASRPHMFYNEGDEDVIILVIDIIRPDKIAKGVSESTTNPFANLENI